MGSVLAAQPTVLDVVTDLSTGWLLISSAL